ncbi:hypothetical protein KC338_g62 [Hortaea werneckii]|nr:hypothetical protein KC338_g62 [Hortaea werneckii]
MSTSRSINASLRACGLSLWSDAMSLNGTRVLLLWQAQHQCLQRIDSLRSLARGIDYFYEVLSTPLAFFD